MSFTREPPFEAGDLSDDRALSYFRDGRSLVAIDAMPAEVPVFLMAGASEGVDPATGLLVSVVDGMRRGWWSLRGSSDGRWKVTISRSRRSWPRLWRVHALEFYPTENDARRRAAAIVSAWEYEKVRVATPLAPWVRSRLRRDSLKAHRSRRP